MDLGPPKIPRTEKSFLIQREYEQKNKKVSEIAAKFNCSTTVIFRLAKKHGWVKFLRTTTIRTAYRNAAAAKMQRELIRGEHVHHVDGVITNNVLTNLHVFENSRTHSECHGSLERAAFELYRRGLIKFNYSTGQYYLPRERKRLDA